MNDGRFDVAHATGAKYVREFFHQEGAQLIGKKAPDVTLPMADGTKIKLSSLKDRLVVLDFWATWCPPCVMSLPIFTKASVPFKSKGVVFIAVNKGEPMATAKSYLKSNHIDATMAADRDERISSAFEVEGIPCTVFIGRDGIIKGVHVGISRDHLAEGFTADLNKFIAGKVFEEGRMKRSQINRIISEAIELFNEKGVRLPPWAYWKQSDWKSVGHEADEIRSHGLGWNLTDFASKDFEKVGLLLFIVRNGHLSHGEPVTTKTYAEKYMVVQPGQITPWHFHWQKTEDLLNRSGGRLQVELAWAGDDEKSLSDREVTVQVDGVQRKISAEGIILLNPGESLTLSPRMCHKFSGYVKDKQVLAGEISSLNDDTTDNCFLGKPFGRTAIDEDEPPKYLICSDYAIA